MHPIPDVSEVWLAPLRLRHWANVRPQRFALKSPTATFTFAQLLAAAERAADEIEALGVRPGDVVAFQLPNWAEAFVLYHAVLRIDAIALPLLPALRDRDLQYMLHETHARLFVTPGEWRGVDHLAMARRVCVPDVSLAVLRESTVAGPFLRPAGRGEAVRQGPAESALPASAGGSLGSLDAVCSILFTSGTSGRPKAVLHTHRSLANEGRAMAEADGIGGDDVLFVPSAVAHVGGPAFGIFMALHAGATVCVLPEWNAQVAVALIERERCTWTAGATPFLQGLVAGAEAQPGALARLRIFRCGGTSVPPSLIERARALGVDAYRSYGLSEHPTVSGRAGQSDAVCAYSDGVVHPLVDVRIVDPNDPGRELAQGVEGEIMTRGPDLSLGYLRAADTAGSRWDGWFLTGDLGRLAADGVLRITGRKKDIIIRKGENIGARELEDLLAEHPAVADIAVIGVPDAERGEMVCCVVVPRGAEPPTLEDLCRHLCERGLATFKLPERLILMRELPYNAAGKLLKNGLRGLLLKDEGDNNPRMTT